MPHVVASANPVSPVQVISANIQIFADMQFSGIEVYGDGVIADQQILLGKIVLFEQSAPNALVTSLTAGGLSAILNQFIGTPADPESQALLCAFGVVVLTYTCNLGGWGTLSTTFVLSGLGRHRTLHGGSGLRLRHSR
jgi:hypothetical protein